VLASYPGVFDAAVVGRPDARWQEVPVAYVIRRAGARVTAVEIEAFCREQLARYKVPRDIVFVDSLPRNAMGKVQHFRLRQLMGEALRLPTRE
jgi:fatty-acyl-CoA synthase